MFNKHDVTLFFIYINSKHDKTILTVALCLVFLHRNLLYSLPGRTAQFSILRISQEEALHCSITSKVAKHNSEKEALCHSTMNQSLSLILRAVQSADRLVCFGMDLFENYPNNI